MRLFLVRHAQTAWNVLGRAQGHTDLELDEIGVEQAARLAERFEGVPLQRIWSSDLCRSAECARAVAKATGAMLTLDRRLRERGMGDWEGLGYEEFNRLFRGVAKPDDPYLLRALPPGGESLEHVWTRVREVLAEIESEEGDLMLVSHGGTCSLILAQLLRGNLESSKSFRFANAGVTELERRPDGLWTMLRYNDAAHLNGKAFLSGNLDGISR